MMVRLLYLWLLRVHPRRFRQRFGEEMLWIFDESNGSATRASFIVDALRSLLRQWVLRPGDEPGGSLPLRSGDDVPVFYAVDLPVRRAVMAHGAVVSLVVFSGLSIAMSSGGPARRTPGSGYQYIVNHRAAASQSRTRPAVKPSAHDNVWTRLVSLLSFSKSTDAEQDMPQVTGRAAAEHATRMPVVAGLQSAPGIADRYFELILVLATLDADRDRMISAAEMDRAPEALAALDHDGDGILSADECGHFIGDLPASQLSPHAVRITIMAFDSDGDGRLHRSEVPERVSGIFDRIDRKRNGYVTVDEIREWVDIGQRDTLEVARFVFMRRNPVLAALDHDANAEISDREMMQSVGSLSGMDRNNDRVLTAEELLP